MRKAHPMAIHFCLTSPCPICVPPQVVYLPPPIAPPVRDDWEWIAPLIDDYEAVL